VAAQTWVTSRASTCHAAGMHRVRVLVGLLGLALAFGLACEARAPEPAPAQPAGEPAPAPAPAPSEPALAPVVVEALPRAGEIHYLELVTAGADPDSPLPMIVAIHGLGDSPQGFRTLLETFDQPARVILPRALDAYEEGWSWFPIRARDRDVEALAQGIARAADALAPAIAELSKTRPTIGKPIVTGFSQGGMLSFELAVHHGELFSAALPIGGWLPEPLWPLAIDGNAAEAPPIVAFHGDADAAVPYEPTKLAVDRLRELGYRVDLETYAGVGHMISPEIYADVMDALRERLPSEPNSAKP
jgi:phospholipase/carboxylesterase